MKYLIHSENSVRVSGVSNGHTNVFYAKLTADFHEKNSVDTAACAMVYAEALLSGAGKYNREALLDAINKLGASISISTSHSTLNVTLRSRHERADKLMRLFVLMLREPRFDAKEIARIKTRLKNQMVELEEDAKYIAHLNLKNTLFGVSDRRHEFTPEALKKAIATVKRSDLVRLHQMVMSVYWQVTVGTDDRGISLFTRTLNSLKKSLPVTILKHSHTPMATQKKLVLKNIPSKQNIEFNIGGPLPMTIHHPDYIPFVFGINVLGKWGGFSGRLMSTVREKEGLTYGIYAKAETVTSNETGYWRIMTFFSPTDAVKGLQSTLREVKKIAESGITSDEHERFITILKTQQTLLADSYVRHIEDLHAYTSIGLSLEEIEHLKNRIITTTKAEVNAALKKYLKLNQVTVSGAGFTSKAPAELSTFTAGK